MKDSIMKLWKRYLVPCLIAGIIIVFLCIRFPALLVIAAVIIIARFRREDISQEPKTDEWKITDVLENTDGSDVNINGTWVHMKNKQNPFEM